MTAQRLSLRSQSRMLPARAPTGSMIPDGDYELDNIEDLASSRPISLSDLCNRASTRSKSTKHWKPLLLDSTGGDDTKETASEEIFPEAGQYKPRSRLSAVHHSNSEECRIGSHQRETRAPSRIHSQGYTLVHRDEANEQGWFENVDSHIQQNPLNYSSGYESSYSQSLSQVQNRVSESSFLKNENYIRSEHAVWPADIHPVSNDRSSLVAPPDSYNQSFFTETQFIAESSFHIYGANFDRPYNQSPYELLQAQNNYYNQIDIHQGASTEQYSFPAPQHEQYIDYAPDYVPMRSETPSRDIFCERLLKFEANPTVQMSIPQSPQSSNPIQVSVISHSKKPFPAESNEPQNVRKRGTKEDVAAYLKSVVLSSIELDEKQMALQYPFLEAKRPSANEHEEQVYKAGKLASLPTSLSDGRESKKESERTLPISHRSISGKEALRLLCKSASIEQPPLPQVHLQNGINEVLKKNLERLSESSRTDFGKILRPPPGLPKPAEREIATTSYLENYSILERARLEEANAWFHKDSRKEVQLRQQVADIAQDYAERNKRVKGAAYPTCESKTARQLTLLLGDVIVNLHSYVSGDPLKQEDYFAKFGDVKRRCCEPSHGGRRSYFDRDPSVDQWRLPSGRAVSNRSDKVDKKLVLSHMHRPQLYASLSDGW